MTAFFTKFLYASLFLLILYSGEINACSCREKLSPTVMDLNDSELVFTATLLEYKIGMAVVSLKFRTNHGYKGTLDQVVTFYFKPKIGHTLFNKDVKFEEQEDWIIFARKKVIGERSYYRLIDDGGGKYCALSRPIMGNPDKDPYLLYLAKMEKQTNGFQKFYNEEDLLIAEGKYEDNNPISEWKYYKPSGELQISGNYMFGKREGEWLKYTTTSKVKDVVIQKRFYHQGELREIHDLKYSGSVTFKKILSDTAEIRHYLNHDGSVKSSIHKNKDDNSMNTINYYDNGVIREKKYFIGNKLMSKHRYDENGQKVSEWIREN